MPLSALQQKEFYAFIDANDLSEIQAFVQAFSEDEIARYLNTVVNEITGETLMHRACEQCDLATVRYLTSIGGELELQNKAGFSAWMVFLKKHTSQENEIFIAEFNLDTSCPLRSGNFPVALAIESKDSSLAFQLMYSREDQSLSKTERNPVFEAMNHLSLEEMPFMIASTLFAEEDYKEGIFFTILLSHHVDFKTNQSADEFSSNQDKLLASAPSYSLSNDIEKGLLFFRESDNSYIYAYFLEKGSDAEKTIAYMLAYDAKILSSLQVDEGRSLLQSFLEMGFFEFIPFLLHNGCDPNEINEEKYSPLDYAKWLDEKWQKLKGKHAKISDYEWEYDVLFRKIPEKSVLSYFSKEKQMQQLDPKIKDYLEESYTEAFKKIFLDEFLPKKGSSDKFGFLGSESLSFSLFAKAKVRKSKGKKMDFVYVIQESEIKEFFELVKKLFYTDSSISNVYFILEIDGHCFSGLIEKSKEKYQMIIIDSLGFLDENFKVERVYEDAIAVFEESILVLTNKEKMQRSYSGCHLFAMQYIFYMMSMKEQTEETIFEYAERQIREAEFEASDRLIIINNMPIHLLKMSEYVKDTIDRVANLSANEKEKKNSRGDILSKHILKYSSIEEKENGKTRERNLRINNKYTKRRDQVSAIFQSCRTLQSLSEMVDQYSLVDLRKRLRSTPSSSKE